ncbi:MAG: serine hydrolase domain-containing protein [Acidobacteriota bacterium]
MTRALPVVFAAILALPLAAQSPAPAPPAGGAPAGRFAALDRVLQEHVDDGRLAGAVALVLQDGKPVYERAVGWSDKEAGRRMAPDTIFRIASQTKAITSAAVLMLVEDGRMSLTEPVSRYLPEFAKATVVGQGGAVVPVKRPITIAHLLTHTAGISYGTEPAVAAAYEAKGLGPAAGYGWYTADKDEPICDTMARLASLPFVAQPGEAYVYGYSTDVLGCVVEKVSGLPLDRFFREKITGPLGMRDTAFYLPSGQSDRLATVYASVMDGPVVRAPAGARGQGHYAEGPRKSFAGGAGLLATARDYARFLEMIRRGGTLDGVRILSPRGVRLMTTNQVGPLYDRASAPLWDFDGGRGFGMGFSTTDAYGANGFEGEGGFGWGGAYGTVYRVDPALRAVLVLMLQQIPNRTDIRTRFQTLVYQALAEPVR